MDTLLHVTTLKNESNLPSVDVASFIFLELHHAVIFEDSWVGLL